ncbi:MAG: family metallopeptidase [Firmicutes bacterium]|nr:family metallopeptidase [Bacillota bacterium]
MFNEDTRSILSRKVRESGQQLIDICSQLVKITSETPPSDTREAAKVFGEMLQQIEGAEVSFHMLQEPVMNVVARIKGKGPGKRLVFNGHLDTFPIGDRETWTVDPFGALQKDGKLFGRGVADMKGGIAIYILAFILLAECREQWSGELVITVSGDEENMGVLGSKYVLDTVPHAAGDAMISGDIGTSKILRFGEKGLLWFELAATGKAGHGAHVHRGINAIDRLIAGIMKIHEGLREIPVNAPERVTRVIETASKVSEIYSGTGETKVLQSITVNFGVIEGGISANLIPAKAMAKGDIRIPAGVTCKQVEEKLEEIVNSFEGLSLKVINAWDPNWSDPDHEIFALIIKNSQEVWGGDVVNTMRVGASDARLYRLLKNVPSVNCGLHGHNLGGPDEYAEIEDMIKVAEIQILTAFDFLTKGTK